MLSEPETISGVSGSLSKAVIDLRSLAHSNLRMHLSRCFMFVLILPPGFPGDYLRPL